MNMMAYMATGRRRYEDLGDHVRRVEREHAEVVHRRVVERRNLIDGGLDVGRLANTGDCIRGAMGSVRGI